MKRLILSCLRVLVYDRQTNERTDGRMDERTDICDCRVAFATENKQNYMFIGNIAFARYNKLKSLKVSK